MIEVNQYKRKVNINDIFVAPEIKLGIYSPSEISLLYSIGIIIEHISISQENWQSIAKSPYQASELIESDGIKDITKKIIK